METNQIQKRLKTEGPHVVRTSDGREYIIQHPEFVWVRKRFIAIENQADGTADIIDPVHVVAVVRMRKETATA
jgi:hypothetical protein